MWKVYPSSKKRIRVSAIGPLNAAPRRGGKGARKWERGERSRESEVKFKVPMSSKREGRAPERLPL